MIGPAGEKAAARAAAFARRATAHAAAGGASAGRLSEVLAGYRGVPLAGYMPIRSEIDPLPAMAEGAELRDGPFGARIPVREEPVEPEILIVPLVAFDLRGNRLGYGGGFYDRTLARLRARRATLAIGFAYDAQEAEDLPLEPTDERLDMVVTESRVLVMS